MSYSGQELVEQEKCKLIYANFFEGVQCFDHARSRLQLSTPDYEQNSYDETTKTFQTSNFTVSPVTILDMANLKRPLIVVQVSNLVSGLKVVLTADEYTKTRIMPIYYLDSCNKSDRPDLKICITNYLGAVVTKVSFETGTLTFLNNSIFKYVNSKGVISLYRLKDQTKGIIFFESDIPPANVHYFPLAYFVEELPVRAEREILFDYHYANPYVTHDVELYPCELTLDPFTTIEDIINSIFSPSVKYQTETVNDWEFMITIFRDNFTLEAHKLTAGILFLDLDTGMYELRSYRFDFYDKYDEPIDLETAIDQGAIDFTELIQDMGEANCSGYYKVYLEGEYVMDREVNRYGYPDCEGTGIYNLEVCGCEGGNNLCLDKILLSCEECDPDTGEVTDICDPDEYCTELGCRGDDYNSACLCEGKEYGILTHPSLAESLGKGVCKDIKYSKYRVLSNGDVQGKMDFELTTLKPLPIDVYNPRKYRPKTPTEKSLPWLTFFNIHDLIVPNQYNYGGTKRSVSVRAFVFMNYFKVTFEELDRVLAYDWLEIPLEMLTALAPEAGALKLDWFKRTTNQKGAYTVTDKPCKYISISTHVKRSGESVVRYKLRLGHSFVYPDIINPEVIANPVDDQDLPTDTGAQASYDIYCEKVRYLGSDIAYTYGVYLDEIPKEGVLEVMTSEEPEGLEED